jgi:hypothetical protein
VEELLGCDLRSLFIQNARKFKQSETLSPITRKDVSKSVQKEQHASGRQSGILDYISESLCCNNPGKRPILLWLNGLQIFVLGAGCDTTGNSCKEYAHQWSEPQPTPGAVWSIPSTESPPHLSLLEMFQNGPIRQSPLAVYISARPRPVTCYMSCLFTQDYVWFPSILVRFLV